MFKPHTVLGLGLLFVIVSFLGVPAMWKIRFYLFAGVVFIIVYLIHLARETIFKLASEEAHRSNSFTQNGKGKEGSEPVLHKSESRTP